MAAIEQVVASALLGMSAVTAIVGGAGGVPSGSSSSSSTASPASPARIRSEHFEVGDGLDGADAILIETDQSEDEPDLSGLGGLPITGLTITCRSGTIAGATALAQAVKHNGTTPGTGLAGYHLVVAGPPSQTFDIVYESSACAHTPRQDASERHFNDEVLTFTVINDEPV
jgi:hypothetical protein